ncbi:unnamed protein product, partial [Owenia fusiformis]
SNVNMESDRLEVVHNTVDLTVNAEQYRLTHDINLDSMSLDSTQEVDSQHANLQYNGNPGGQLREDYLGNITNTALSLLDVEQTTNDEKVQKNIDYIRDKWNGDVTTYSSPKKQRNSEFGKLHQNGNSSTHSSPRSKRGKSARRPRKLPEIPIKRTTPSPSVSKRSSMSSPMSVSSEGLMGESYDSTVGIATSNQSLAEELSNASGVGDSMKANNRISMNSDISDFSVDSGHGSEHTMEKSQQRIRTINGSFNNNEFVSCAPDPEFIEQQPKIDTQLDPNVQPSFDSSSKSQSTTKAFLSSSNQYLVEDSSPDEKPQKVTNKKTHKENLTSPTFPAIDPEVYEATHRVVHKFLPRHDDEMELEIGDPVYVYDEADDLWCEGVNLRTQERGIFPTVYATDLSFLEDEEDRKVSPRRFYLRFLGSIEINYHKGNDVLCQAIHKVAHTRRMTMNSAVPPLCSLEITEYGIKMTDKTKPQKPKKADSPSANFNIRKRIAKILSKHNKARHDHFFSLKNVSFCGYHPKNERYFGFITKHPVEMRFACHVFIGEDSTKCIAEAVGKAFKAFFQEYMAFTHPTEDIYLE